MHKPDSHYVFTDAPNTVISLFFSAMLNVFSGDMLRVKKGMLSQGEGDPMLLLILFIFLLIPLEPDPLH